MASKTNYSIVESLFMTFYIADRNKTTFQYEEEVPDIIRIVCIIFSLLFLF